MSINEPHEDDDILLRQIKRPLPEGDLEFDFDKPPDHPDPLSLFEIKEEDLSDDEVASKIVTESAKIDEKTQLDYTVIAIQNDFNCQIKLQTTPKLIDAEKECDGSEDFPAEDNTVAEEMTSDEEILSTIRDKLTETDKKVVKVDKKVPQKSKKKRNVRRSNEKRMECPKCNKSFRYRSSMKKHLDQQHNAAELVTTTNPDDTTTTTLPEKTKKHPCVICNARFETMNLYEDHFKEQHNDDRPYQCCVCKQFYHSKSNMIRHRTTHPEYRSEAKPQKRFECEICGKKLLAKSYKMHMNQHLGQDLFECDICHRKFAAAFILRKHLRIHTNPRNKCEICGKIMKLKTQMDEHMVSHGLEMKYVCDCGSKFVSQRTLNAHKLTHIERDPLQCRYCSKMFDDLDALDVHIIAEHKVPPKPVDPTKSFLCDICGKELISKSAMRVSYPYYFDCFEIF